MGHQQLRTPLKTTDEGKTTGIQEALASYLGRFHPIQSNNLILQSSLF